MEYYKQGDAANADKIKAAFESKGIDTSANSNYGISNLFYFSCNGDMYYETYYPKLKLLDNVTHWMPIVPPRKEE